MKRIAVILLVLLSFAGLASAEVLYSNGYDPGLASWKVNHGYAVTNSFVLQSSSQISDVAFSVWDVNDLNTPRLAQWSITTEPFGGTVVAHGSGFMGLISRCQETHTFMCQWEMELHINSVVLPAGTYWLQVDDLETKFVTWAFWGQSNAGVSQAYQKYGTRGDSQIEAIPSESFVVLGIQE